MLETVQSINGKIKSQLNVPSGTFVGDNLIFPDEKQLKKCQMRNLPIFALQQNTKWKKTENSILNENLKKKKNCKWKMNFSEDIRKSHENSCTKLVHVMSTGADMTRLIYDFIQKPII